MKKILIAIVVCCVLITGCGRPRTAVYYPPEKHQASYESEYFVDKSFNETWEGLCEFYTRHFSGIKYLEKDSGLIGFNLGEMNASRYVNCGVIEGFIRNNSDIERPRVRYDGQYISAYKNTLNGLVKIHVTPYVDGRSKIVVNIDYSVAVYDYSMLRAPSIFNFNSYSQGEMDHRICQSSLLAEQIILNGIKQINGDKDLVIVQDLSVFTHDKEIVNLLNSQGFTGVKTAAKKIVRYKPKSQEIYSKVAELLEDESTSGYLTIDTLAWLVKAISFSGNKKYIPLLSKLDGIGSWKLSRQVKRSIQVLSEQR